MDQHQFQLKNTAYPGQQQAVNELVSLALTVARNQRGEDHLQDRSIILGKFYHEYAEFYEAKNQKTRLDMLSELADLVYYSVQDFVLSGDELDLRETVAYLSKESGVTVEQAYTVALAKYRLRAFNSKDFAKENAAIEQALRGA